MLSIVIVTRNTRDLLRDLLRSVERDTSLKSTTKEIVVVDNGSTDATEGMIDKGFPWVSYVRNEENRGFAAAVNLGYRHVSGDFILFLNSDTRVLPGEIEKMVAFMGQEPKVGVAAPQLIYEDMRPQRSFALTPSLALEVIPPPLLEAVFPGRYRTKGQGVSSAMDVESVIGAAIMVRRQAFDLVGGFDERFFFFLEETDFCLRTGEKGYRVVFFPGSRLIHLQGKTVSRNWVSGRIEYSISLYKFIRKYHSRAYYKVFVLARLCKTFLFLLPVTLLPFVLFRRSIKRKYRYYVRLLVWHLRGCPDDAGLRSTLKNK